MIGTKRIAAWLMASTTVVAAGGSGAYYYKTGTPPWALLTQRSDAGKAQLKPQAAGDSQLDAVASAWTESKAPRSVAQTATPPARPAGATTADASSRAGSAATASSRYERYSAVQPAAATVPDSSNKSEISSLATADSRGDDAVRSVERADRLVAPAAAMSMQPPAEGLSVVRGQNPSDGASASVEAGVFRDDAAPSAIVVGDTGTGANALRLPDEPARPSGGTNPSAARARQAFTDAMPAPAAGGYRAAADGNRKTDAGPTDAGARLNPFALQPAQAGAAGPQAPSGALPPLPAPAGGLADSPLGAASNYDRSSDPGRLAPNNYRTAPGANYNAGQPRGMAGGPLSSAPIGGGLMPAMGPGGEIGNGPEGTGKPGERALEGAQNPALLIQKQAPAEIQVGKQAKFLIQVRNMGGQAAADVVVRDEVPQGTRLVSSSPIAEMAGGQMMWRFGTLSVGEERTIELQLMPTAEGEIGSVATVSYSAQASIKTRSTMPQLAIKMSAPKQVMVGQEQRVKILLHNPGSGDATGVMLLENVPENVRHAAGPALEFEVGTLRAGETRELELVLLAQKAGKVTNVLSARAEGSLQVQQQVDFEVIAPALTVAVVGPERRYLERPATYQVRVENPGTATARDIQLVTKLPKGMKFVRANNMGEYDANTHAVYWSLAELPEKEQGSVELVAMPIETGPQTLEVEGRAQQGLSDQTKQQILVEGLAAIMFEVRDLEDPIELGRETAYEIRIVNQGTKAATNVQVAAALPPGMQFVSAEGETKHAVQAGVVVFAPIKQLAPKVDSVYRLKLKGTAPGDQRITVEVKTDDLTNPIRREESTRVFGDD